VIEKNDLGEPDGCWKKEQVGKAPSDGESTGYPA
jgi:hypothetical protein